MKDTPMQWLQTVPTISRLDYIATAIFAGYLTNPHNYECIPFNRAVSEAKALIAELDKEENHE